MVRIEELVFGYGGRLLYDGMDMTIKDGAVYGLLGRNGAGKTTLMKLIAGLLRCGGGMIDVDGQVPFERRPEFLDGICYVPESTCTPDISVEDYAFSVGRFYSGYDGDALTKFLREFEVEPNSYFRRLSFGQKKKAMLSVALSLNTRLLLLDEPGNGLDIPSKQCFRRLLSDWIRNDRTVVLSTHNVRDVAEMVSHVAVMDRGRLLVNMPLSEIGERIVSFRSVGRVDNAVFSERVHGGYVNIIKKDSGSGSDGSGVDLETFFNACINGGRNFINIVMEKNIMGEKNYEQ